MNKKLIYQGAIEILGKEVITLGGAVFARYWANFNKEAKNNVEAMEFMNRLLEGNLKIEEEDYLEPYLKPFREMVGAIEKLSEYQEK